MHIVFVVVTVFIILVVLSHWSKMGKAKETAKREKDAQDRKNSEDVMRPEIKLHEAEKKRWEDDYWKSRERKDPPG